MPSSKNELRILTVHLPDAYIKGLDELVSKRLYPNRSEAIRVAVRDLLKTELWERAAPSPRTVKMYG
ncbi:MAG: CopG family transcriptional regulator [Thermoprotei archaeon]|nr:MAG: CopG family transcriptional regulator [Thermoprotei archaeon]